MNKLLIIAPILLFQIISYCNAQMFEIGITPNIVISKLHYQEKKENSYYRPGLGYAFQIPVKYTITKAIKIQSNPGFALYSSNFEGYGFTPRFKFSYFTFPIYLNIIAQENFGFYVGTDLSYMVMDKIEVSGNVSPANPIVNKFLYGPSGGLSFNFTPRIKIQYFYTYGLSTLIKDLYNVDESGVPISPEKLMLWHMELGLSYKLF